MIAHKEMCIGFLCLSRFFCFVLPPVFLYISFTPSSFIVVKKRRNTKYVLKANILKSGNKKEQFIQLSLKIKHFQTVMFIISVTVLCTC